MRSFLNNLLSIALFFYSLLMVTELLLYVRMQNNRAHALEDWPDLVDCNFDVIFLGSSRTAEHVIPDIVETNTRLMVYNMGYDGFGINMAKNRLEYYLENCKKQPEIIILEADFPFCSKKRSAGNFLMKEGVLRYFFLDQLGINKYFRPFDNWRSADEYAPVLRYKGFPLTFLKHLYGWNKWDRRTEKGFWYPKNAPITFSNLSVNRDAQHTFAGVDSICHLNGIEFIGLMPPSINGEMQPNDSILAKIEASHTLWNFSLLFQGDSMLFRDNRHLTLEGAHLYSHELNKNLLQHIGLERFQTQLNALQLP